MAGKHGQAEKYDRALALHPEDVVGFVKDTQPEQWEKFCTLYPSAPEPATLLQERRTALISAAVTGKIDVRHWQPPAGSVLENNCHRHQLNCFRNGNSSRQRPILPF